MPTAGTILSVAASIILFSQTLLAADAPRQYEIPKVEGKTVVDAVLDETQWLDAVLIEAPIETHPGNNIPTDIRTECKLMHSSSHLNVACRAYDPDPSQIRAFLTDRDKAGDQDWIGLSVDTFDDERRGFGFYVNPLGVQMDQSGDDAVNAFDFSWDAIWESAGRLTDDGYVVELSIPFSQLRFQKTTTGQTWGISITRHRPRDRAYFLRSEARDRDISCQRCQYSKITGFVDIAGGRNLEINPTLTGIRTDEREEIDSSLETTDQEVELGITALWGFRPNASLSATINPDFSQVEADAAQLGINERFSLFFEEKRPFFLEGANYFETPIDAVYTRTVVSPTWGAKITGKEGRNAFGMYIAEDDVTALLFPGAEESDREIFDEGHHTAVLRYRRDVGQTSSLGAIVTARRGDHYSNAVYGVDGVLRLSPADTIRFQALGSQTEYPEDIREEYDQPDGTLEDTAFMANYFHESEDWMWGLHFEQFGNEFRADSGFVPQVGVRALWGGLWRVWRGDDTTWYSRNSLGAEMVQVEDIDGNLLVRVAEVGWSFSGGMRSQTRIEVEHGDEVVEGVSFPGQTGIQFHGGFWPLGNLELRFHGGLGDQVDYANIQPGEQVRLEPGLTWRPGKHWEVNLDHEYRHLDVEDGRLFTANLSQMRLVYYLNVRTFVRAILQYTDVERDPALYQDEVEAHETRLFSQLLFSYKLNARTVVFVGYSDNTDSNDALSDVIMNRSVFVKLGYAWLL